MFSFFARRPKTVRLWAGAAAVSALALGAAALHLFAAKSTPAVNPHTVAADPSVQKIAAANTDFGFRLLKQLVKMSPKQNVFVSPFSISSALMLTLNGAGGATHKGMTAALRLSKLTTNQTNSAYGLLLPSLEAPDPQVTLTAANALWANRGTTFNPQYQAEARRFFGARVQTLDMASPVAAPTINGWISGKTHGKIEELVTPRDIATSAAVLTNAVYFHGKWSEPFEKSGTHPGPFTLVSGTKSLPLMSQESAFDYTETTQFQAVRLPYGQGRVSLYVLLPKRGITPAAVVNGLTPASWNQTLGKMQRADVALTLPRFRVGYSAMLNGPLKALGMGSAFAPGADFAPMGLHGGFISAVIHKAILEVDEQGAVAAAATGVMMPTGAASPLPMKPIVMRVNHPFVCLLRDTATGTVLFAGVIQDPE